MALMITLTVAFVVTVLAELGLWFLFRRRAAPLSFPPEFDASYHRFFQMSRLRLIMLAHTTFILIVLGILYIFLW